jgi:phosphoribosylanthranilate isomerase
MNPDDAQAALEVGAGAIACVFYAASPRYVTLTQAWEIRRCVPSDVPFIGIFVDAPVPLVSRIVDHCGLDRAQLFGSEPREIVDAVHHAFKGVTVDSTEAAEEAIRTYVGRRPGRSQDTPGFLLHLTGVVGNDWRLAGRATERVPTIVAAAGLTPQTAGALLETARPWAVDVWDAVESAPGHLDLPKLRELVAAVHEADGTIGAVRA